MIIVHCAPADMSLGGTEVGGISKHVADLTKNVKGINHVIYSKTQRKKVVTEELILLKSKPKKATKLYYTVSNIEFLIKLWRYHKFSFRELISICSRHYLLNQYIKKLSQDFKLHIHSLMNDDVFFLLDSQFNNSICTEHGFTHSIDYDKEKKSGKLQAKLELLKSSKSKIIAISNYSKININSISPHADVIQILNPISTEKFDITATTDNLNLFHSNDCRYIFFNGFNDSISRKGFDILIKSLEFSDRKITLIANVGSEVRHENILVGNPRVKVVMLRGMISNMDLNYIYKNSDLFVMPSRSEGFGLVYIEALYHGTRIIGFYETLKEFQDIFEEREIIIPFNANADNPTKLLWHEIKSTLDKPVNLERLVELKQKIKNKLSWSYSKDLFLQVYEK